MLDVEGMKMSYASHPSNRRVLLRRIPVFAATLFLAGCIGRAGEETGGISVGEPWARAMPVFPEQGGASANSAVYLTLRNHGDSVVHLVGGRSPVAEAVEVHESRMVDGVMTMRPIQALPLPPDSTVRLRPGGLHLMLMGLTHALQEGGTVDLTLEFRGIPELSITVPVRASGSL